MARIRILHVLHGFGTGGTEQGVRKLLDGLRSQDFEQLVCVAGRGQTDAEHNGVRIMALRPSGRSGGFAVARLIQIIAREKPDIVHSRNWGAIEAVPAAQLAGIQGIVHSEHGLDVSNMQGEIWRRRTFRRLCFRWAHRVFMVSEGLRRHWSRELGIPEATIEVIPNGVDTVKFRFDSDARARLRTQLNLSNSSVVVGTVSRLDPVKDHETLLRAAEEVVARGLDLHVVIVGEGPEKAKLQQQVRNNPGLSSRVHFVGEVQDVPGWLSSFDVYALPSLAEGMSNTLLEAMSVGLPALATSVGGNAEVIQHGCSGLLFEPGDVTHLAELLMRMVSQPEWRRAVGEQARLRIENCFSLEKMLARYADLYRELAARKRVTQASFSRAFRAP